MVKKKTKKSQLTLHGLLTALSYWGTSVRLFLAVFVSIVVFAIALSETTGSLTAVSGEVIILLYVLGCVLLLDLGYVIIARALALRPRLDAASLILADIGLLGLYALPKVTVTTVTALVNPIGVALLIVILILALRLLAGILFSPKRAK